MESVVTEGPVAGGACCLLILGLLLGRHKNVNDGDVKATEKSNRSKSCGRARRRLQAACDNGPSVSLLLLCLAPRSSRFLFLSDDILYLRRRFSALNGRVFLKRSRGDPGRPRCVGLSLLWWFHFLRFGCRGNATFSSSCQSAIEWTAFFFLVQHRRGRGPEAHPRLNNGRRCPSSVDAEWKYGG